MASPKMTRFSESSTATQAGIPEKIKASLDSVAKVEIDANGRFKYVLIKVYHPDYENEIRYIVRGFSWAEFHGDIYDAAMSRVSQVGLKTECVGGGKIQHEAEKKILKAFGSSQGFGRADHKITVDLLKKKYPDYTVSFSNDGFKEKKDEKENG